MNKRLFASTFFSLVTFLGLASSIVLAQPKIEVKNVSQIFRNIAVITDTSTIQTIYDEFLIPEFVDETEKIEIIDVGGIGFGSFDVLVVYPSLRVYLLENSSPELANIMRNWSIEELRRDASNELAPDYFYPVFAETLKTKPPIDLQKELVPNALIADILESLERNYKAKPISFRFERDEEGFTYQIWNHKLDAFEFNPRPKIGNGLGSNLLYLLYRESSLVAKDTLTDIIFLNKTVEDSVILPQVIQRDFIREYRECEICVNIYEDVSQKRTSLIVGLHSLILPSTTMNIDGNYGAGIDLALLLKPANYFFKIGWGTSFIPNFNLGLIDNEPLPDEGDIKTTTNLINTNLSTMMGFYWRSSKLLGGYAGLGARVQTQFYDGFNSTDFKGSGFVELALNFGKLSLFFRPSVISPKDFVGYNDVGFNYSIRNFRRN